jgi:citrate synthase
MTESQNPEARLSDVDAANLVHTRLWLEEPEADNPFAARAAYCRGYDVFGEMVGRARWADMLCLLFCEELPPKPVREAFEALAVALANPGPRDPSVHAAMCGGVGGSSAAACLMAALSVGAGRYQGARDVHDAMLAWQACGTDLEAWRGHFRPAPEAEAEIWPPREHPAGFEPHGASTPAPVRQLLEALARIAGTPALGWLARQRGELERAFGMPLQLSGVAAAALHDFGFSPQAGEMLYLMLRLPGAAAHALEQQALGYKRFPFPPVELEDDPALREAT